MVKVKNANVGKGEDFEGGNIRGMTGKGKRVAFGVRAPIRFISVKETANLEEWPRKREGKLLKLGKIYNKHTFKMGFAKNEEGMLVRGVQDDYDNESDEDDEGNEGQEVMNIDEEESETEPKEEINRREIRQKKRQEQVKEGQSSVSMTQIMDMIASLQASKNSRLDALDEKISDVQERLYIEEQKMHKRSLKGNLQKRKISLKTTRVYEDEVIKLNTLKIRKIVRGKPVVQFSVISLKSVIRFSATKKIGGPILGFQNENRSSNFSKGIKNRLSYFKIGHLTFSRQLKIGLHILKRVIRFFVHKKIKRPILKTGRPIFTFTTAKKMTVG
ncbi:hypothetical protein M9H77_23173 [Catharanthus roseus]|uniref:Uncharacterized protein n=2 Tax=Catharanthus roseus TaxID=4058 RepID=A0ACC0ASJ4_CATRO|nr:hypothetical protein M9H77_23172 [Catharanthus roseus]KAI5663850.1 hypothetical protein M9H77_23173 [Catharanthus roseus]